MSGLTKQQEQFVLDNWNKIDLLLLVRQTFNNHELTLRHAEAKLVKKFLAERKLKKEIVTGNTHVLTESQKEYIRNGIDTLTPLEIAQIIFDNRKLEPTSQEVILIQNYVNSLDKGTKKFPHDDYAEEEYRPPDQLSAVVTKVNQFLRKDLSLKTMPTVQKRTMEAVRNFLHAPRYLQTINSYLSKKAREMFEGEFVRSIFDKPDLTPDELNLVITLCQHYVMGVTLHRQLDMLNIRYEETLNDPDGKLTVPLAEMVKAKSMELEKCNKAQTDLTKFLNGERSKRQERQGSGQISVARLVEWFRDEKERKQALKRAEIQNLEDEEEVKRLEEISETKARVLGISKSELLYG